MQIVIDIPAYVAGLCVENNINDSVDIAILIDAVKNGIPLPKHHGRLIDADAIIDTGFSKGFCDWYDEIKSASTIIEADKEVRG